MTGPGDLARRWLGLPRRRCSVSAERQWVALPDGVRLATLHLWPHGLARAETPTVVMRTPYGVLRRPRTTLWLGRLVAATGYHVLLQDVRGRYGSEGRFSPFANEAADGAAVLAWLAEQPWFDGRAALVGASYLAYSAFAALGAAPEHVRAVAVALGASDLYPVFHPGGAFSLATALEWGTGVGERVAVPPRRVDLARGLCFRPVREADRVAVRQTDWYRDWVDHPRRDAYWDALRPALPARPPAVLSLAGWYDFFLDAQLADARALASASQASGAPAPRLVVGPWAHGLPARWIRRGRGSGLLGVTLRELLRFLEIHLRGEGEDLLPPVRLFVLGANRWREERHWPVSGAEERRWFARNEGRLDPDPPGSGETPERFRFDPAAPVPTCGGALLTRGCGAADQRRVEARPDVLCFTSPPLERDVEVIGPVRAVLWFASSAPDTDVTAKLVDVAPGGPALNLCEGILRARWRESDDAGKDPVWLRPGEPVRVEIRLGATACRFRAGHAIRLEVSSSNFPRFDRNANTRDEPGRARPEDSAVAEQTVFHDAARPSHLVLPVVEG